MPPMFQILTYLPLEILADPEFQGDGISNIRRSGLEDLLRGHQPQLWIEELMLRAQSLE